MTSAGSVSSREQVMAAAGLVRAARMSSSVFTDLVFGYRSAPFHEAWHREWNRAGAHVVQWDPVEHGKTQQVTGWALHRLGTDPEDTRILWIGSAQSAAKKSTNVIKTLIEEPPKTLSAVFPNLRPARGSAEKWTETQFRVQGAKATEKDYSVEVVGVGGAVLGGRVTHAILDDICTFETTYTADQRLKITKWVLSTVMGRLLAGAGIFCLGNAWFPDDVMHELAAMGFTVIREQAYAETDDGKIIPETILWPAQWPLERLEAKRHELGTVETLRQLRCQPYSSGQGRFKLEWFERAMKEGSGLTLVDEYHGPWPTFLGVDVGVNEKPGRDPWGFWCMAVDPQTQRRRVLDGMQARMDGPDGIARLKAWHRRFGPVTMVENNAAQEFIRQFAGAEGIPTRPFTTGKNKADPAFGVPSLGVELEQGMWILPSGDERSRALAATWRTQCLAFAPGQHTGDLLMASWFAREAARQGMPGATAVAAPPASPVNYGQHKANYEAPAGRFFRR